MPYLTKRRCHTVKIIYGRVLYAVKNLLFTSMRGSVAEKCECLVLQHYIKGRKTPHEI